MSHPRQDLLAHMRSAVSDALAFVDGMSQREFLDDRRTQQAVLMSPIILGEASTKLLQNDPDWAATNPGIPLRSMRGMRDRLAHGYFDIDFELVWSTVRDDLPRLASALDAVLTPRPSTRG